MAPSASDRGKGTVTRGQLAKLLAPTLGRAKSDEAIAEACEHLAMGPSEELRLEQARAIIDHLCSSAGLVGVVARFVKSGRALAGLAAAAPSSQPPLPPAASAGPADYPRSHPAAAPSPSGLGLQDLQPLLAPALGDDKAREAIATYSALVGATHDLLTRAQALEVLELMAGAEGLLGVVARFAKSRLVLRMPR